MEAVNAFLILSPALVERWIDTPASLQSTVLNAEIIASLVDTAMISATVWTGHGSIVVPQADLIPILKFVMVEHVQQGGSVTPVLVRVGGQRLSNAAAQSADLTAVLKHVK